MCAPPGWGGQLKGQEGGGRGRCRAEAAGFPVLLYALLPGGDGMDAVGPLSASRQAVAAVARVRDGSLRRQRELGVRAPRRACQAHDATRRLLQGGVVLGADTRATEGDTVADKNCEKIHYIADNIWCCGAGTSADTEATTALISSQLELSLPMTDGT